MVESMKGDDIKGSKFTANGHVISLSHTLNWVMLSKRGIWTGFLSYKIPFFYFHIFKCMHLSLIKLRKQKYVAKKENELFIITRFLQRLAVFFRLFLCKIYEFQSNK